MVYERRPRDGSDAVRTVLASPVSGQRLFLIRHNDIPHAVVLTPRGQIVLLDLWAPPERSQPLPVPLIADAQTLLDVLATSDGTLYVAWTDGTHRTWMTQTGQAPTFIALIPPLSVFLL